MVHDTIGQHAAVDLRRYRHRVGFADLVHHLPIRAKARREHLERTSLLSIRLILKLKIFGVDMQQRANVKIILAAAAKQRIEP